MGYVVRLKRNQLVGGNNSDDIYPITATNAVYRGNKSLEEILDEMSSSKEKKVVEDILYSETSNRGTLTIKYTDNSSKEIVINFPESSTPITPTSTLYPIITTEFDSTNNVNIIKFTNNLSDKISFLHLKPIVKNKNVYIPVKLMVDDSVETIDMMTNLPYSTSKSDLYHNFSWSECNVGVTIDSSDIWKWDTTHANELNDASLLYTAYQGQRVHYDNPNGVYLCVETPYNSIYDNDNHYLKSQSTRIPANTIGDNDLYLNYQKYPTELYKSNIIGKSGSEHPPLTTRFKCFVLNSNNVTDSEGLQRNANYQYLNIIPIFSNNLTSKNSEIII